MVYRFEEFELDLDRRSLVRAGEAVSLEPQVFDLLVLLVRSEGRAVRKDEIVDEIWQGRAISDAALTSRIKSLRRALGDEGRAQRMIKTLHRIGYQFLPAVAEASALPSPPPKAEPLSTRRASAAPAPPPQADDLRLVYVLALGTVGDEEQLEADAAAADRLRAIADGVAGPTGAEVIATAAGDVQLVFGLARSREDNHWHAVRAALEAVERAGAAGLSAASAVLSGRVVARQSDDGAPAPTGRVFTRVQRLLETAAPGDVLVAEEIAARLPQATRTAAADPLTGSGAGIVRVTHVPAYGERRRPEPAFVGRRLALGQTQLFRDEAQEGRGTLLMVRGPAGIGKSRFCREIGARIGAMGATVLTVRFTDMAGTPSFDRQIFAELEIDAALVEAAGQGAPEVVKAALRRAVMDDPQDQSLLAATTEERAAEIAAEAVVALFAHIGRRRPILLTVEDTHWAAPSDILALCAMAVRLSSLPVLLLATERPGEERLQPALAEGEALPWSELPLQPLNGAEARALLKALGHSPSDALLQRAGGNPLFLTQLAGGPVDLNAPNDLAEHVQARLDRLAPEAAEAVRFLSVLGETIRLDFATACLARPRIDQACASGFLRLGGTVLSFEHALVRDAVYASIPRETRRACHAAAAEAAGYGQPVLRAEHALRAESADAAAACSAAVRAHCMARRLSMAEDLIARAQALPEIDAAAEATIEIGVGTLAREKGDLNGAIAAYRRAATNPADGSAALHGFARLSWVTQRSGDVAEAERYLSEGLAREADERARGNRLTGLARAELRWRAAALAEARDAYAEAMAHVAEGLEISDHPHATARLLGLRGTARFRMEQIAEAATDLTEALAMARRNGLGMVETELLALELLARFRAAPDEVTPAHATLTVDRAEAFGVPKTIAECRLVRAHIARHRGRDRTDTGELAAQDLAHVAAAAHLLDRHHRAMLTALGVDRP